MTIRTAILEARFLLGDRKLFDELVTRFDNEVVRNTATEFVAAKPAERERVRRSGQSRYLVEPNVKDGGTRRSAHVILDCKYVYRVREPDELIKRGVFDKQEYQRFRACEDFLVCARHALSYGAPRSACRSISSARSQFGSGTPNILVCGRRALHEALLLTLKTGDLTASSVLNWRIATPRACQF